MGKWKEMTNGPLEFEARVLNALIEPTFKRHAFRKLGKFQESKGWVFSQETGEFNQVSDDEELERELFLDLSGKVVAILASDKKGVAGSVENLLSLALADADGFNSLYQAAIEANPGLAPKQPGAEVASPN